MTAPEFREVFMCKLTTATTCYSAARVVSSETQSSFLATERHVLEMKLDNTSGDNKEIDTTGDRSTSTSTDGSSKDNFLLKKDNFSFAEDFVPIPAGIPRRIAKKLICVGYSHCQGWEAFVLLDTSRAQESSEQQQRQQQQHGDDDKTIVTLDGAASTSAAAAGGGGGTGTGTGSSANNNNTNNNNITPRPTRRRVSSGNGSVSSTDTGTSLTSSTSASSAMPAVISIDSSTGTTRSGGGTAATASTTGGGGGKNKKLGNLEENDDEEEDTEETKQPLSRLVLQHRETQRQYSKGLDFRPLSPRITILLDQQDLPDDLTQNNDMVDNPTAKNNDESSADDDEEEKGNVAVTANRQPLVGVWVGSADDTKLRMFQNTDNGNTNVLMETKIVCCKDDDESNDNQLIKSDTISFQSPVMAIDTVSLLSTLSLPSNQTADNPMGSGDEKQTVQALTSANQRFLVVACQDGTISFFGYYWSSSGSTLHCREECTVVVDGPIVSLHLNVKKNDDEYEEIEAVVGSLCGYVARFYRKIVVDTQHFPSDNADNATSNRDETCWQGPFMVAEGFGTGPSAQEDSILAVHSWGDKVALGTYSGRCLLYGNDGSVPCGEDYGLPYWSCQLPDPIHGICHIPSQEKGTVQILVTTRRSLHVFQEIPKVYHPERTKRKLEMLLSHQRHNSFSMSNPRNMVATGTTATAAAAATTTPTISIQPKETEETRPDEQIIAADNDEADLPVQATTVLEELPKVD